LARGNDELDYKQHFFHFFIIFLILDNVLLHFSYGGHYEPGKLTLT